jgi:virginiamycin B lyase
MNQRYLLLAALAACVAMPAGAFAQPVAPAPAAPVIVEFPIPTLASHPSCIVAGPDGNMWFTEATVNKIGMITPSGNVTEFLIPTKDSSPSCIAAGPDGNLWFTESARIADKVGRITPRGVITEFAVPTAQNSLGGITAGNDGNLWFTEAGSDVTRMAGDAMTKYAFGANGIGRITPSGAVTEFIAGTSEARPRFIAPSADGNLWFTESGIGLNQRSPFTPGDMFSKVGRITPGGVVTEFALPSSNGLPGYIIPGAKGYMWFTEPNVRRIARLAPSGTVIELAVPSAPLGLATGRDLDLWFTEAAGMLGHISADGTVTEFPIPAAGSDPAYITTGPAGTLWFTDPGANKIGRVTL